MLPNILLCFLVLILCIIGVVLIDSLIVLINFILFFVISIMHNRGINFELM